MNSLHFPAALAIALVLSGCAALSPDKEPLRITPVSEVASSLVVREVLPPAVLSSPTPAPPAVNSGVTGAAPTLASVAPALTAPPTSAPAPPPASAAPSLPPGTLYVCTATVNGQVQRTAIEFAPKVRQLCGKHPEMGVCQYEREACRASGGLVHTTKGVEITRQTEAEYDKKVLRVRFRAG